MIDIHYQFYLLIFLLSILYTSPFFYLYFSIFLFLIFLFLIVFHITLYIALHHNIFIFCILFFITCILFYIFISNDLSASISWSPHCLYSLILILILSFLSMLGSTCFWYLTYLYFLILMLFFYLWWVDHFILLLCFGEYLLCCWRLCSSKIWIFIQLPISLLFFVVFLFLVYFSVPVNQFVFRIFFVFDSFLCSSF